jgi:hypothetical protein
VALVRNVGLAHTGANLGLVFLIGGLLTALGVGVLTASRLGGLTRLRSVL